MKNSVIAVSGRRFMVAALAAVLAGILTVGLTSCSSQVSGKPGQTTLRYWLWDSG